jgi:hypothetical protein
VRHIFRSGSSITGPLLARGIAEIPGEYKHGARMRATVTVFDQNGQKYPSEVSLWANRSTRLRPAAPKLRPIFESRDPVPRKRLMEP